MKKTTVVRATSMPPKPPIILSIAGWTWLDRIAAPGWAFGVFWTIVAVFTIGFVVQLVQMKPKEPLWKD